MKFHKVAILALIVILLLASWAIAWARPDKDGEPGAYQVAPGSVAGNGYQLHRLTWQVSGALRGEGYSMPNPVLSSSITSGCCCTFLPCLTR
jgi:hypothetical protein